MLNKERDMQRKIGRARYAQVAKAAARAARSALFAMPAFKVRGREATLLWRLYRYQVRVMVFA